MKKIYYLGLLLPLVMSSCQTDQPERTDGKGAIVISSAQNVELDPNVFLTRAAADVNEFTLYVTDEADPSNTISGKFSEFPNGTIDNLEPGSFTVKLTSHPEGFVPAFEDPMYEAVETGVEVAANTNTRIKLEATQANAGVFFVYDESLYSKGGFSEVVPTITQGENELVYQEVNQESRGYFHPQDAVLSLRDGNEVLTLAGETSRILELREQQLWQVTLKVSGEDQYGNITIEASVKVITDPTNFIEFEIGKEITAPENGWVDITMYDLTPTSAVMHIGKKDADVIWGRFAIYTQDLVDQYLGRGYTLEEAIMLQGYDLEEDEIMLINADAFEEKFSLTSPTNDYVAIVYVEIEGGQRALTTQPFETPPAPVTAVYSWNWYGDFNNDFTYYGNPVAKTLDLRYHEYYYWGIILLDADYVFYNFFGVQDFNFRVSYDKENNEIVAPGNLMEYDGNWLNSISLIVTFTDPATGAETDYDGGFYIWDENMNMVERGMVFNTDQDGYITSSKYHITYDLYEYGSGGDPEYFVERYQLAPMNDPISISGTGAGLNSMPENTKIKVKSPATAEKSAAVREIKTSFVQR
ncbi:MAG: DUF4493 domain-containing protein [Rikenellaceae bacterium]|nr:DUF4493 domain-containing protein [Rikenellaceae bacterium]